ncbi:hypothetical protein B0H13DRAFT_2316387 [Mycena leptocephala]|nr:hypothetical protein B0H13DRAFT_2316387 [Mycena leptocephala]
MLKFGIHEPLGDFLSGWGWLFDTVWAVRAVNDLFIASTLVVLLYRRRSLGLKSTAAVVNKMVTSTIETGVDKHRHASSSPSATGLYLEFLPRSFASETAPDKYSVTVEFFKSLGDASEPAPHAELMNCFKNWLQGPADAMRAVRKNGEIHGGSWMLGAKWAVCRGAPEPPRRAAQLTRPTAMSVDTLGAGHAYGGTSTLTVSTPIKLAPSASAFRRAAAGPSAPKPGPAPQAPSWPNDAAPASAAAVAPGGKGVLGQASDMIFGW